MPTKKDLKDRIEELKERIEELKEENYGNQEWGKRQFEYSKELKEENEVLKKRIRELENDSSCKNCGSGEGRVGCGKDCFQDNE